LRLVDRNTALFINKSSLNGLFPFRINFRVSIQESGISYDALLKDAIDRVSTYSLLLWSENLLDSKLTADGWRLTAYIFELLSSGWLTKISKWNIVGKDPWNETKRQPLYRLGFMLLLTKVALLGETRQLFMGETPKTTLAPQDRTFAQPNLQHQVLSVNQVVYYNDFAPQKGR
jgi:hypothetical protein